MFNRLVIAIVGLALSSCMTRKPKSEFEEIADFGLSDDGAGVKVDDKAYFDDLKRSESSVGFESSLPLPFRVGKSVDSFDRIPPLASPGHASRLSVHIGPCTFTLLSGPIQVDRYLLAGQWIKLTEGLPAKAPVKLEPNQDLNIKAVTKIGIEISESMTPICRRMFEGRKIFLGRFHLNKSRLGLVSGPGSPNIVFGARSLEPQGKILFIHWQTGSNTPSLIDDFDFPATAESGIFRAQMSNKGYYYLAFQTVLRMDQVDSMVIKLPYDGNIGQATKAPSPPPPVVSGPVNPPAKTVQPAVKTSVPGAKIPLPAGKPSAPGVNKAMPAVKTSLPAGKADAQKKPVAAYPAKTRRKSARKGVKASLKAPPSEMRHPSKPKK